MGHYAIGASVAVLALSVLVHAAIAAPVCTGTDPTLRPILPALAPTVAAAFHARMTPEEVERNGFVRCDHDTVLACLTGANLNCGKANTAQTNPGAAYWCHSHPNAEFIPAFATGHETIYAWRCRGTQAAIDRQVQQLDPSGFVAGAWKPLR